MTAFILHIKTYYPFGMQIKERSWSSTSASILTHVPKDPSTTIQLADGSIEVLQSTPWNSGGHSAQEYTTDCKVVWSDPEIYCMVGLSYNDFVNYTNMSYKVYRKAANDTYIYYLAGSNVMNPTSISYAAGDQVVVERKDDRSYMYIIRIGGTRVKIGDWAETAASKPIKAAYTGRYAGAILKVAFYSQQGNGYRFGFNGQAGDNEVKGEGNSYDFGARVYDSRLGRFLSRDIKFREYPFFSPYIFAANSPIVLIDVLGNNPGRPGVVNNSASYLLTRKFLITGRMNGNAFSRGAFTDLKNGEMEFSVSRAIGTVSTRGAKEGVDNKTIEKIDQTQYGGALAVAEAIRIVTISRVDNEIIEQILDQTIVVYLDAEGNNIGSLVTTTKYNRTYEILSDGTDIQTEETIPVTETTKFNYSNASLSLKKQVDKSSDMNEKAYFVDKLLDSFLGAGSHDDDDHQEDRNEASKILQSKVETEISK